MGHEQAVRASEENISACHGRPKVCRANAEITESDTEHFAVMTAYFGVYPVFREACQG